MFELYMRKILIAKRLGKAENEVFQRCLSQIRASGISALATGNALDSSVVNRTHTCKEDQIYAIQQIFRFRLGKTSLDAHFRAATTLSELEEQFSKEMLRCHPLSSALFVRPTEAEVGKAWMTCGKMVIPATILFDFIGILNDDDNALYETTGFVNETIESELWARFKGSTCSYSKLDEACTRLDAWPPLVKHLQHPFYSRFVNNTLNFYPDISTDLRNAGARWEDYLPAWTQVPRTKQQELQQKLRETFSPEKLMVLSFGCYQDRKLQFGLLMVCRTHRKGHTKFNNWRRIAVLAWNTFLTILHEFEFDDREFLYWSSGWSISSGLFG